MKKSMILIAAVLLLSILSGCGKQPAGEASVQSVSMICGIGSVGRVDRFAGVVNPRSETEIKKDEEKTIAEVRVQAGDEVIAGQVLFTYDMEQVQFNLEKARLELEQLKNTVTAKQNEKTALEKEKASVGADQQLSYTLEIQEADAAILETNYNISLKEKEIQKMEDALNNLEVKSPVNGRVQNINETGATDNNGNPLPYMTIMETGTWRIKGYVNEENASALAEGTKVLIRSRVDEQTWSGSITKIDWESASKAGSSSEETSDDVTSSNKYPFYIELDSDEGLILGQHVYIEPDYGQEAEQGQAQLELPAYYINDADGSPWVWTQGDNGRLEKRSVTLGEYNQDADAYVIESGLTAEDYIAFPSEELKDGMKCVEFDAASQPAAGDAADAPEESVEAGVVEE